VTERTILVVDDEFDILDIVADILRDEGHRVLTARNGAEALERLDAEEVDLILLDIMMPVMSGPEMLETLRARSADVPPVIVMSAGAGRATADQAGDAFLQKPFEIEQLVALTERLLARGGENPPAAKGSA
jgi:DNA-binding response OmpR family regulator